MYYKTMTKKNLNVKFKKQQRNYKENNINLDSGFDRYHRVKTKCSAVSCGSFSPLLSSHEADV